MEKASMFQAIVGFAFAALIMAGGFVVAHRGGKKVSHSRSK
jgi:hypothetical protein